MAPVYDYLCRTCGAQTTLDRRPEGDAEMRHLKEDGTVCGTFRRDWKTVNLNRENIRAVGR